MGVNPLYYHNDGGRFIFSSEIKAILTHDILRRVDKTAFNLYMQLLYTPEPYTMFEGIKKLKAAHILRYKDKKISIQRYWDVDDTSNIQSKAEAKMRIHELFRASVKRQLISDRPVGIFLSGGIDSTAVLGAASEFHDGRVNTFSVGFKDSLNHKKFNADADLARKTAQCYNTDHHELMIGPEDIKKSLKEMVWHMDEPNANPTAAAIYALSQVAKKDVAVVLGGDGADELFGGYPRYFYSQLISTFDTLPHILQKTGISLLQSVGRSHIAKKLQQRPNEERVVGFLSQKDEVLSRIIASNVYEPTASNEYMKTTYFPHESHMRDKDFEKYFMHVDRQSWLVDESLLRTNKMTMAYGLEARVPILDPALVKLAARIPTSWKFGLLQRPSQFQGKNIWRDAIADYLPPHILSQKKRGWFTPMSKWMRTGLHDTISDILSKDNLNEEFFDYKEVQTMWNDHVSGGGYHVASLWAIVAWQLWYNEFFRK